MVWIYMLNKCFWFALFSDLLFNANANCYCIIIFHQSKDSFMFIYAELFKVHVLTQSAYFISVLLALTTDMVVFIRFRFLILYNSEAFGGRTPTRAWYYTNWGPLDGPMQTASETIPRSEIPRSASHLRLGQVFGCLFGILFSSD